MLCTFSKYKISDSIRIALPSRLNTNFLIQQFHPKRALLITTLPIDHKPPLTIINTHFSAFAQHTNTLQQQAKITYQILSKLQRHNKPAILSGDLNLLGHPSLRKHVSIHDQKYYAEKKTALSPYFLKFNSFPNLSQLRGTNKKNFYTYSATSEEKKKFDRTIDFIFSTKKLNIIKAHIIHKDTHTLSDHLPLYALLQLPKK